jgi:elongator complex protein 3
MASSLRAPRSASEPERSFDPVPHRRELLAIIREVIAVGSEPGGVDPSRPGGPLAPADFDPILRRHPKEGRGFFSRAEIIAGFRRFEAEAGFGIDEERFLQRVLLRPVRTQSGVTPLTVLTKPYPCPGRCIFCPNDVRMPKSYLSDEPGAQRAATNHFDPYLQTWNRLDAYRAIGHPTQKIELIILGGTWSYHPEAYQIWFIDRCLAALNDFGAGVDGRDRVRVAFEDFDPANPSDREARYNGVVTRHLKDGLGGELLADWEDASWSQLEATQRANEAAACRNVGLVVETRPDHLSPEEVVRIRRLGCTKVQIGYQSLSDDVLARNARGHDVAATRSAMRLLRAAGFKVHAHWMPNLLGSSPALDRADFARVFDDSDFRPDEIKIYPCSLIETAELVDYYQSGEWVPYSHDELLEVLTDALSRVPRYCRITRVIRDISSDDIVVGNKLTNFRQIAERALEQRGGVCSDIRAREIRGRAFEEDALTLRETQYSTSIGLECFLEFVTDEDHIVGFLRLALPEEPSFIEEIAGSALIREVHVYGSALGLGARSSERAQHRGLGQRLIAAAALRARDAGFAQLAVISAIGTRPYYRRQGFEDGVLYQHRSLGTDEVS